MEPGRVNIEPINVEQQLSGREQYVVVGERTKIGEDEYLTRTVCERRVENGVSFLEMKTTRQLLLPPGSDQKMNSTVHSDDDPGYKNVLDKEVESMVGPGDTSNGFPEALQPGPDFSFRAIGLTVGFSSISKGGWLSVGFGIPDDKAVKLEVGIYGGRGYVGVTPNHTILPCQDCKAPLLLPRHCTKLDGPSGQGA